MRALRHIRDAEPGWCGIYWQLYQLQYKDQELGVPQDEGGDD